MSKWQSDRGPRSPNLTTLQQLVQAEQDEDIEGIKVTVKHIHQYQSSGLLEAGLALLVALFFTFGSVFLAIAAVNFYQGVQSHRTSSLY